jgi:hypothetical protein
LFHLFNLVRHDRVPLLVERLARVVIARTHQNITPADVAVLSQRFMRATVALTLVQGAARTLAQPEHAVFNIFEKTALGQYYMLGTVIFYLFDSVLLGLQRATTYDLWVHHLIAIGLYSYYLARGVSEMGGMLTLFSEILVPWGFMLFYFKLNKLQAHKFFQGILVLRRGNKMPYLVNLLFSLVFFLNLLT